MVGRRIAERLCGKVMGLRPLPFPSLPLAPLPSHPQLTFHAQE